MNAQAFFEGVGQCLGSWQSDRSGETEIIRRKLIQGAAREASQPLSRIRFKQMGAAIDRVHRLAFPGLTRIPRDEILIGLSKWGHQIMQRVV